MRPRRADRLRGQNQYVSRKVIGGVYPVSTTSGPAAPDGTSSPLPFPFLNVTTAAARFTTNSGGPSAARPGPSPPPSSPVRADQRHLRRDQRDLAAGDIDLGIGPTPLATDCRCRRPLRRRHQVGRSAFYELTRINEQARGNCREHWLQTSLLANVNILQTCNANGTAPACSSSVTAARLPQHG